MTFIAKPRLAPEPDPIEDCRWIALTRDAFTLVNAWDYYWLIKWLWFCTKNGYAIRNAGRRRSPILMHRLIMQAPDDMDVDHISGDTLDNRRSNLRVCTHAENICNKRISSANTSGYKGIHWYKAYNKWSAEIWFNYKKHFLGYFSDIEEAKEAYNKAALELHGKFAKINK